MYYSREIKVTLIPSRNEAEVGFEMFDLYDGLLEDDEETRSLVIRFEDLGKKSESEIASRVLDAVKDNVRDPSLTLDKLKLIWKTA